MSQNLFERVISEENIQDAFRKTQLGKGKYKSEAILFSKNETHNLQILVKSLVDETYEFSDYEEFTVYEPKERVINAPRYRDKIVQIALNNVLKEVYNKCFIYDSYACIDNKGTHKCVDRIQNFMRKAKRKHGDSCYIIKIDIKKFFYSIDREILKKVVSKKIKCKKTFRLICKIIDSANVIDEVGLPLGNTLSQICANIYLNELDQYAKRGLRLKYYVRFADDLVIVVENKQRAIKVLNLIEKYLHEALKLETNKSKTKIFPLRQGVNSVGFKIHTTHRLLRNDSKKRIKRKSKKMLKLIITNKMTIDKAEQMLNSWNGHAMHGCSKNFVDYLLTKNKHICLTQKGTFKINRSIILKNGGRLEC